MLIIATEIYIYSENVIHEIFRDTFERCSIDKNNLGYTSKEPIKQGILLVENL